MKMSVQQPWQHIATFEGDLHVVAPMPLGPRGSNRAPPHPAALNADSLTTSMIDRQMSDAARGQSSGSHNEFYLCKSVYICPTYMCAIEATGLLAALANHSDQSPPARA